MAIDEPRIWEFFMLAKWKWYRWSDALSGQGTPGKGVIGQAAAGREAADEAKTATPPISGAEKREIGRYHIAREAQTYHRGYESRQKTLSLPCILYGEDWMPDIANMAVIKSSLDSHPHAQNTYVISERYQRGSMWAASHSRPGSLAGNSPHSWASPIRGCGMEHNEHT